MAPRRATKVGLRRIGAALDALRPMGFPDGVVRKTIRSLLTVYGEEGWPFIEDASYKVLLEAILEKENGEGTSDSKKPAAETSRGTTLEPACSDVNPVNTASQTSNGLDCASEANEALCTAKLTNESGKHLPSVEAEDSIKSHVQYPCSTSHSSPPPSHNPPPLPGSNSAAKRRPYYGWICSDDEEDLVELRPGPLAEEMENWLSSFIEHKKKVGFKT